MIEKQLSDKIKIGSLICTFGVVFRHSLNLQAFGISEFSPSILTYIENGVSKMTEVAVPFFFIVSGFFFMRYAYTSINEYFDMVKKKTKTLFIPFVLWNVLGIIPLLLTHKFVYENNQLCYLTQLLHSDWNGVLWYVRDIMTMMLLAPLYTWIFKVNSSLIYLVFFVFLFYLWLPVDCSWMSSEGMIFFFIGGMLQKRKYVLNLRINKSWLLLLVTLWFISCFIYPKLWTIHRYNTLLGIIILWFALDRIPERFKRYLIELAPFSFFIYVIHLDIIKSMKVFLASAFYRNEVIALLTYIILPVITFWVCILIAKKWSKYLPKTFYIFTGGRG